MVHMTQADENDELCLWVLHSGCDSGTTFGRANGVHSVIRRYGIDMQVEQTSREWCILGNGTSPFSAKGDSGAVVADFNGRIGGMITGGSAPPGGDKFDTTYATPFWWLLKRIQQKGNFPNATLNVQV
ncbi:hypothetical protein DL96DRAFT_838172 [Flagelloscypha sp. PMI_526]|nr:hypothetical protein DL96DRAFT_838172 [Flagelloscypha sp. PMI_526]